MQGTLDYPRGTLSGIMVPLLLCAVLLAAGCIVAESREQVQREVLRELAEKVTPVNRSIPAPALPPRGPRTINLELVKRRSAQIKQLKIEELVVGEGPKVADDKWVTLDYHGTLPDGYVFETTYAPNKEKMRFKYGPDSEVQPLKVWYEGLRGMKVGGKRRITAPASVAYGPDPPRGSKVPPNAAIILEIELLFVSQS